MDTSTYIYEDKIWNIKDRKFITLNNAHYEISENVNGDKPGILIYVSGCEFLSFLIYNNRLWIYNAAEYDYFASIIQYVRIEYMICDSVLNLDMLMPYLEKVTSMYKDIKIQTEELFKQGRQTKRAN